MSDGILELLNKIIAKGQEVAKIGEEITNDTNKILSAFGMAAPEQAVARQARWTFTIDRNIHYIEGDEFILWGRDNLRPKIAGSEYLGKFKTYGAAMEEYNRRTEKLESYELRDKTTPDPNFESYEAAMDYLENRQ